MTLAITPRYSNSTLVIQINAMLSNNSNKFTVGALFQDSTAGALAAGSNWDATGEGPTFTLTHAMTAGTTSATTFKFRAGPSAAATITFNGIGGSRKFGAITKSSMVIFEYSA